MAINATTANTDRSNRRSFHTLAAVGALLISLSCAPPAQGQCSGAGGGGAGGRTPPGGAATGGLAAGGSLNTGANNLGQLQQMAALVQQQAIIQQQQQMEILQRRQALAAAQQRQAMIGQTQKPSNTRAPAPYTFVEAAQRRRAAYLRVRRQRNADEHLFVSADRNQ